MLTRLVVRNFKTLEDVDIELGQNVVLIGQNNSGKTSALQALALWQTGMRAWTSRRTPGKATERPGVTINRRDLTHTPVPEARLLWRGLRVNAATRQNGDQETQHVFIDIQVDGQKNGEAWNCGFEFYYANPESIYCRPLRRGRGETPSRMIVPQLARETRIAFLPPMSGLVSEEAELQAGRIEVLIGEGQTAQVLRNLCALVHQRDPSAWRRICGHITSIFGADLDVPIRDEVRGSIQLKYRQDGTLLDISSAGRGLQQTLLLLAHMHANPGATLLLDEPDAHLEILRQRQIYNVITDAALSAGSQVIAASHSEVLLNEAADRDVVISFVGRPHRINDRGSQLVKALREIGYEQYFQAEIKRAVLYLEGATDLQMLKALAERFDHPARSVLDDPFVHYVGNEPQRAASHFFGLREAVPGLHAVAVFDRLERGFPPGYAIPCHMWQRNEIENYLCQPAILLRWAAGDETDDLVVRVFRERRIAAMAEAIRKVETAFAVLDDDPWGDGIKASERVLPILFRNFFLELDLKNEMNKRDYHELARFAERSDIADEIFAVLDMIREQLGQPEGC